jgi:hypothetical protein
MGTDIQKNIGLVIVALITVLIGLQVFPDIVSAEQTAQATTGLDNTAGTVLQFVQVITAVAVLGMAGLFFLKKGKGG